MKVAVPCRIWQRAEDDCWYVESPYFYDGIITDGDTAEEAKRMAKEAIGGLIASRLSHGQDCRIPQRASGGEGWCDVVVSVPECEVAVPHKKAALAV